MLSDDALRTVLEPPTTEWRSRPGLRDAAVLVPWFTRDGEDLILYTKRMPDLKSHAGEISFPGGAREGEEDALACALREAREEVGLAPDTVTVFGRLPERVSIASYLVHVFVARIPPPAGLACDPCEVDSLVELAVRELRRPERWEWRERVSRTGVRRKVPFFEFAGGPLWGLTAILTLDLLERVVGVGEPPPT
jgi:8-oxo-dGTP pyrophosphatase MutT (NUDIX family)